MSEARMTWSSQESGMLVLLVLGSFSTDFFFLQGILWKDYKSHCIWRLFAGTIMTPGSTWQFVLPNTSAPIARACTVFKSRAQSPLHGLSDYAGWPVFPPQLTFTQSCHSGKDHKLSVSRTRKVESCLAKTTVLLDALFHLNGLKDPSQLLHFS